MGANAGGSDPSSAIIGFLLGLILTIIAWALKGASRSRDREMETVQAVAVVRVRVDTVAEQLGRIERAIEHSAEHYDRALGDVSHELSDLRATVRAHIEATEGSNGRAI